MTATLRGRSLWTTFLFSAFVVSSAAFTQSVSPDHITTELGPGNSSTHTITIATGATPVPQIDVVFAIDRTGSMGDEINTVKQQATQILNSVRTLLPDSWFGVASFMDYPGVYSYPGYSDRYGDASYGDVPYMVNQQLTDNTTAVSASLNALWLGWGGDWAQDYTRVLYELESFHWRAGSKKLVIMFGDAPTHDINFAGFNFGGDPGRDGVSGNADDLDFETVVAQLQEEGITVLAVNSGDDIYAAATFQGMSIGHAGASGTRGQYFRLENSSQIPAAINLMVQQEVSVIDVLSLDVQEPYDSWITVTPAEHTNVGPNVSRSFSVTISVPSGTASGEYSFLIRAVGDGSLLGQVATTVLVAAGSELTDLGFRADPDGYGFQNEGATLTWDMFEQFFGQDAVRCPNGDRRYAAEEFFNNSYSQAGNGGICDGFSSSSLINFLSLSQSSSGAFALAHRDQLHSASRGDVLNSIRYYQGCQQGYEIAVFRGQMLSAGPRGVFEALRDLIHNHGAATLAIFHGEGDDRAGHAIVPYRIEENTADQTANVWVYDCNHPGDNDRRVEFDLADNSWSYIFDTRFFFFHTTWSGDAAHPNISLTPLSLYLHRGISFWDPGASSGSAITAIGPGALALLTPSGQRLGYFDETYYEEIPGAASLVPLIAANPVQSGEGFYVPDGVAYGAIVRGSDSCPSRLNAFVPGMAASVNPIGTRQGDSDLIRVDAAGLSVAVQGSAGHHFKATLDRELPQASRIGSVDRVEASPSDQFTLSFAASDSVFAVRNAGPARGFDLLLAQRGSGQGTFGAGDCPIGADETQTFRPQDWSNLTTAPVLVAIDRGNDGTIDVQYELERTGSIGGSVAETGSGLLGAAVSLFDSRGRLVGTSYSDGAGRYQLSDIPIGNYTVSLVPPLGYSAVFTNRGARVPGIVGSAPATVDFECQKLNITPSQQSANYWKREAAVNLQDVEGDVISLDSGAVAAYDFANLADQIYFHFQLNQICPVPIFGDQYPPVRKSKTQLVYEQLGGYVRPHVELPIEDLREVRPTSQGLYAGEMSWRDRAHVELTALLLNLASGRLATFHQGTIDGRTVGQVVVYCSQLIYNDRSDDDEIASTWLYNLNMGLLLPGSAVPSTTPNVAFMLAGDAELTSRSVLDGCYPNPFNPQTTIVYTLPNAGHASIHVYNVLGQQVVTLVDEYQSAGEHSVMWDATGMESGVYFYRLTAAGYSTSRKMVLLK